MKIIMFLFFCSGIVLSSCNTKSSVSENDVKEIIIEKYKNMRTTLKSGDPNYVLNMHTKDAVLFLQNGKEVAGVIELRPLYEKVASTGIEINSAPTKIELISENLAFEIGVFTSTSKTGEQNSAKYINIWKRVEGDWKIFKAIDQAKL